MFATRPVLGEFILRGLCVCVRLCVCLCVTMYVCVYECVRGVRVGAGAAHLHSHSTERRTYIYTHVLSAKKISGPPKVLGLTTFCALKMLVIIIYYTLIDTYH